LKEGENLQGVAGFPVVGAAAGFCLKLRKRKKNHKI